MRLGVRPGLSPGRFRLADAEPCDQPEIGAARSPLNREPSRSCRKFRSIQISERPKHNTGSTNIHSFPDSPRKFP